MNDELDMVYLMAQISHEIRTPLNGIKGFGELLLDESAGQLNEVQKKYLTKMLDSTEKLSQIVERVLDWAKLESKQSQLSIEEVQDVYKRQVVSESGADFIKTSTGFAGGGATLEDVALLRAHVAEHVKVKAAGGIKTVEQAQALIAAGAERLGASSLLAQLKE